MQQVARETWVAFEQRLERAQVPAPQRPDYHRWTRFYLDSMLITVHDGKGQKDRTVPLPGCALAEIRAQMEFVRRLHAQDLAAGYAGTFLPRQLERKYDDDLPANRSERDLERGQKPAGLPVM
jgi:hypothetical protein